MRLEQVLERVWPGRAVEAEPLAGGITNRNFKVSLDGEAYVVRIPGRGSELLGIDRHCEHEASLVAARLGIGPEVVRFVHGCLVTNYVEGEVGRIDPAEVGGLLRKLHDGPPIPARFDAFRVVEAYAASALARGVPIPPLYTSAKELADRVETRRGAFRLRPCHNDLLPANFIHDGTRAWIVDWEYAGMGDPFFDLANFAVNNDLEEEGERELASAYGTDEFDALTLMRYVSDFREAMWGVVQQGISELDVDFAAYAAEHFERLERTAQSGRFRRALAL